MYSLARYVQGMSIASHVYFAEALRNFKNDQRGVTAVEYAIVASGVAAVVTVIFGDKGPFNTMLSSAFANISKAVLAAIK